MLNFASLNIKKKKSMGNIWFALDKDTENLVHIDDVARGLKCNCYCPLCKTDLEARQGEVRVHHFSHVCNRDCVYDEELSIYEAVYALLKQVKYLTVPEILLRNSLNRLFSGEEFRQRVCLGQNSEGVCKGVQEIEITNVFYHCDATQYPPQLAIQSNDLLIQIILDFNNYYNYTDKYALKDLGRQNNTSILLIKLGDARTLQSKDELQNMIFNDISNKTWLYSSLAKNFADEIILRAIHTPTIRGNEYVGQIMVHCPLHKRKAGDLTYADVKRDCTECEYCLSTYPVLCLGYSGIKSVTDLSKSTEDLNYNKSIIINSNNQAHRIKGSISCTSCGSVIDKIYEKSVEDLEPVDMYYDYQTGVYTFNENCVCPECDEKIEGEYTMVKSTSTRKQVCPCCDTDLTDCGVIIKETGECKSIIEAQDLIEQYLCAECGAILDNSIILQRYIRRLCDDVIKYVTEPTTQIPKQIGITPMSKLKGVLEYMVDTDVIFNEVICDYSEEQQAILQEVVL